MAMLAVTFLLAAAASLATTREVFDAEVGKNYELYRELVVGDTIQAWGVYNDITTSKFSVNIMGANNEYLLHVDFRPWNNVVVLNNLVIGQGWKTEIRPAFHNSKFTSGATFKVCVKVMDDGYHIYFNDEELSEKFPHRIAPSRANSVKLAGGSNGFEWTALHLPSASEERLAGIPFPASKGLTYRPERTLQVGDTITAWGVFAVNTYKFSVNLRQEDGDYMIHVDFRPPPSENKVSINSWFMYWHKPAKTEMPEFRNGHAFKVELYCSTDKFHIFVDGKELGTTFPYRSNYFTLDSVTRVELHGGSNGMTWTDLQFPEDSALGKYIINPALSTSQSSTAHNGASSRAIDGNTNGIWSSGTCTHTSVDTNAWWSVQLEAKYAVTQVILANRLNACCQDRIDGAKVYVGDVFCGEVQYKHNQKFYKISCDGAVGSEVSVRLDGESKVLTLCEVQVFGNPSDDTPLSNIAPGLPTSQTTTSHGGDASRATDGNRNARYHAGSCTHTTGGAVNAWYLKLVEAYDVDRVVIHNRKDCCQNRLDGAEVWVGKDEKCGTVQYKAGQDVYVIDCKGARGRKITILKENSPLTLCEVEVLARISKKESVVINVAPGGKATQDSIGWEGSASRAIDGNTNGVYRDGSCSHTGDLQNSWWNLELAEPTPINKVVIYNREDCCQDRLDKAQVWVDDVKCGKVNWVEGQRVYIIHCSSAEQEFVVGTNVMVKGRDGVYLTLCEVKVFSDPRNSVDNNLVNLAYMKPTSQSSTGWGGVSGRAVDGSIAAVYSKDSCTHTNGAGWWKVDLQNNYNVKKVWIRNRKDCCSERLNGAKVYVGDMLCGVIDIVHQRGDYKLNYEMECGIVGDSVKIVNENTHLTLCEVKVYGRNEPIDDVTEEEVEGDKSGSGDDDTSVAKCPSGKVVRYCESLNGGVHSKCDGAMVKPDQPNKCVAINSASGNGVKARAICANNDQVKDPCNGPNIPTYTTVYEQGANPSVSCPAGYSPAVCNGRSPWTFNHIKNKGVNSKGVIPSSSDCKISGCTGKNWCGVSQVCKLNDDLAEYAAEVCSTCDGYHCGEDEECVMVDFEDDGVEIPTCVEKQTGCDDNDRCGHEGECIPKGKDGYTCLCNDGYEFNPITGSCIVTHTIWDTVIGEEALGDDAVSYAECPSGKFVMRCHTYGAPSAADGVYITLNEDGTSVCVARASHAETYPIRAVAYCGERATMKDACTTSQIHSTEYRFNSGHSPSVQCPPGYYMASCIFHSPWSQCMKSEAHAQVRSIGNVAIDDDGVCSVPDCLDDNHQADRYYCKLSAVCTKLSGDEYMMEACPTCEQVECPANFTCAISAENNLPVCSPRIPGGCEVDRCGSGKCIEDGPDYTCECASGFQFDGTTCLDVNECDELPCGNGECVNTAGGYDCECNAGYSADKGTCVDVNECAESAVNPCSELEECSNLEGTYICACKDTFVRSADGSCVCTDGFQTVNGVCVDIDECQNNPCAEGERCTNSIGNYECACPLEDGYEIGPDGACKKYEVLECGVTARKEGYASFAGKNVNVKLIGELNANLKKYASIVWTKDNEAWDPATEGKERFNGFTIMDFQAENAGLYVGKIFIEKPDGDYKCEVVIPITLKEGSCTIDIDNRDRLAATKPAGKPFIIMCRVKLTNVRLDEPNNPNNVDWYRVVPGEADQKIEETEVLKINKKGGTYRLWFGNPTVEDSGTYKCEFNEQNVRASTEVSILVA